MYNLAGRSIIITGSASGIGEAAARLAAKEGAKLVLADMDVDRLKALADELKSGDGEVRTIVADVSREDDVKAIVDLAISAYGRLDGAFNNAGIPPQGKPLAELGLEQFQRVFAVNVQGVFLCMKHEIAAMHATGGGAIVNTCSVAGLVAAPLAPEYVASKHAVLGLTRSAAFDYSCRGIRVNAIMPGGTKTRMFETSTAGMTGVEELVASQHPLGRMAEPIEPAQAALWLLSDAASFVAGAGLVVDGGYTVG